MCLLGLGQLSIGMTDLTALGFDVDLVAMSDGDGFGITQNGDEGPEEMFALFDLSRARIGSLSPGRRHVVALRSPRSWKMRLV